MNPGKLARLIYPGFRVGTSDPGQALKLIELGVGGFCFYGGKAAEVYETTRAFRSASETPLLIASDYENGAGQWVLGATELPSSMAIGASGSETLARRKGEITALEARALGVDWVFAPVVDLASEPSNPIVNVRAFGADPNLVSVLAGAYLSGLSSQGALSTLKHFPGHGGTGTDSHLELPVLDKNPQALEEGDLKPFRSLLNRADSVMAGHLMLPELDRAGPASLSERLLTGLLRKKMKYGGVVLTDALEMKAVSKAPRAGVKAFLAGADILLVPDDPFALHSELVDAFNSGVITAAAVELALARQALLVRKLSPFRPDPSCFNILRCPEHLSFNSEAAAGCLAWAFGGGSFALRPGETVGYFEPLTSSRDWKGNFFAEELALLGARVEPFAPGCGMKLAAGCFSKPKAGSGSINLSPEEKAALAGAVSGAADSVALAFGSPFVLNGLRPAAALCAFCPLEEFQRTAARVLFGVARAGGTMPVNIDRLSDEGTHYE
ncbi:MAG: hypothetical protein COX65_10485 [Elusimicrobia bacterium CG_4_10_14_0_2_um_filter_56_8]|nr:MAG: hypothetical protein AUJ51_05410 [Elusimicrobia bacterium CG1_02_56_21]PJA11416.1 MAG: hypothetical protein COX65_10485 [Elusimicrobia bacterium CG_4_10_14_0_2_um_filter_56_8]